MLNSRSIFKSLSTSKQPCEALGTKATFLQCFSDQLKAYHEALNVSCISHFFARFLYPSNAWKKTCGQNEAAEAMINFYHYYRSIILNYAKRNSNSVCPIPCGSDYFEPTGTWTIFSLLPNCKQTAVIFSMKSKHQVLFL